MSGVGVADPLRHHGDRETGPGLLDLAVNVFPGPPPPWLLDALRASLDDIGAYPSVATAEADVARHHGRADDEVLATAGAAEAFGLIARAARWRRPVVVHPQFTEPQAALEQAGRAVTEVRLARPFVMDPAAVPDDADLVVVGNPTNPTGVLHPREALLTLLRPGRTVVVDEAFMDVVPGGADSLAGERRAGLVVVRSLTKHWGIPGVRAGYLLGPAAVVAGLRRAQVPWSVSAAATAAMLATTSPQAVVESRRRAGCLLAWRDHLTSALAGAGVDHLESAASFVLARPGIGVHDRLREHGVAVRRCDTFPGLTDAWVRIAVRPPESTDRLITELAAVMSTAATTDRGAPR